jgi:hypothetical protein
MADPGSDAELDLDAALSAELDGELDAYVADEGLDAATVRERLGASDAVARRNHLAAVRAALVEREPLDEVTRHRLLAGVTDPAARPPSPRRDRSWLPRALAAAAVVLVGLAGVLLLTRGGGGDGAARSSAGGSAASGRPVAGDLGDLGAVSAAQVSGLLSGTRPPAASAPQRDSSLSAAKPSAASDRGQVPPAGASTAQVDACVQAYSADGEVRFRGSGVFQGRPAVVLGVDTSTRTIAFVVAAGDCTQVLYSASR